MIELFKSVVIMSIIGSLLTLLLVVIRPITEKKFSAKWHYETKKLILLFFVIPMTAMMDINITNLNKSYNSDVIINNETFEKEVNKDNNEEVNKERFDNLKPLEDNQVKSDVRVISKDTINKVINIWIIGMILFLCWYIYCYLRFSIEIKKYCKFLKEDSDLMKLISGLRKELNIKQSFKVYNSKILDSPLVTGFFNKKLILPDNLKDDINIKPILMHELTHIRRGDLTIKFAITLISIVHWFNPFIYLLKREIDEYCELSCDEGITVNMSQKEKNTGNLY